MNWINKITKRITTISLTLLTGLTLFTEFVAAMGTRFFQDPLAMAILALVSARIHPTTLVGLLLLGVYIAVNEFDRKETANSSPISKFHLLGIAVAIAYIGFTLALWVDLYLVTDYVTHLIVDTSRFVYTSPLTHILDQTPVRNVEMALRSSVDTIEENLLRNRGRDLRWPLYLFVSYISVSQMTKFTGWKHVSSRPIRIVVLSVMTIIVLLYGLILGHNFFPGFDALPWRSTTITRWMLAHTALSGLVLFILRRTTAPDRTDRIPSTSTSLIVFLLLGMVIAVLDSLSPIPELLVLSVAGIILADHFTSVSWFNVVSPEILDVEAHFVSSLGTAWERPIRLFSILIIFQGFWWGGHVLWLILFSVGNPFVGASTVTQVVIPTAIFLPLVAAIVYSMAFWFLELRWHPSEYTPGTPHRLPDLLTAPTLVIASYLTATHLFDIHPIISLLSLSGVFAGTYGMWRSIQQARSGVSTSSLLARHAVPIAFLIQAGGLGLTFALFDFTYRSPGSPFLLLLGTLGPLYFFPQIQEKGISFLSPSVAAPLSVAITGVFAVGYLLSVGEASLLNGGFLSLAAVVLALSRISWAGQD